MYSTLIVLSFLPDSPGNCTHMLHTQLQFRNSADYFGQPVSMDSQHVPEHGNGVIPGPLTQIR